MRDLLFLKKNSKRKQMRNAVKLFLENYNKSAITAYSGQSAFFLILSFFPFQLFVFSLLSYTPLSKEDFIGWILSILPQSLSGAIEGLAREVYSSGTGIISVTIISAVYLSSKAFLCLSQGMDEMYGVTEKRNFILERVYAVIYSVVFAVFLVLVLGMLVFGQIIFDSLLVYRIVFCFPFLIGFFWLLYIFLPNRKAVIMYQLPGAVISAIVLIIFSAAFSIYVERFSNYSSFYGTMTTIALTMVWLYWCMNMIFVGGLINSTIEDIKNTSDIDLAK